MDTEKLIVIIPLVISAFMAFVSLGWPVHNRSFQLLCRVLSLWCLMVIPILLSWDWIWEHPQLVGYIILPFIIVLIYFFREMFPIMNLLLWPKRVCVLIAWRRYHPIPTVYEDRSRIEVTYRDDFSLYYITATVKVHFDSQNDRYPTRIRASNIVLNIYGRDSELCRFEYIGDQLDSVRLEPRGKPGSSQKTDYTFRAKSEVKPILGDAVSCRLRFGAVEMGPVTNRHLKSKKFKVKSRAEA